MAFKVQISQVICICAMLLAEPRLTIADKGNDQQITRGLESFGVNLFTQLAKKNPKQNIVLSPFSIQTCLAMARMGAEGNTALQMDRALTSSVQKTDVWANYYHNMLSDYENSNVLKMANKIYAMKNYTLQDEFNKLLSEKFFSTAESVDFAQNIAAANKINSWVEEKTNNLIPKLVDPSLLNGNTRLVLVNAIYFKGNWDIQFDEDETRERDFYLDETKTVKVSMMRVKANFKYGELDNLDAKILEMPYKDSDLSMFVILPNKYTGLAKLEKKLKKVSFSDMIAQMYDTEVLVDMPKFKAEFQQELLAPLFRMGLKSMFTPRAEFGKMVKSHKPLYVSSVIHKAFIEVNERGTEAAASTAFGLADRVLGLPPKKFNADHGFVYVIRSKNGAVLFQGKQVSGQ